MLRAPLVLCCICLSELDKPSRREILTRVLRQIEVRAFAPI